MDLIVGAPWTSLLVRHGPHCWSVVSPAGATLSKQHAPRQQARSDCRVDWVPNLPVLRYGVQATSPRAHRSTPHCQHWHTEYGVPSRSRGLVSVVTHRVCRAGDLITGTQVDISMSSLAHRSTSQHTVVLPFWLADGLWLPTFSCICSSADSMACRRPHHGHTGRHLIVSTGTQSMSCQAGREALSLL